MDFHDIQYVIKSPESTPSAKFKFDFVSCLGCV